MARTVAEAVASARETMNDAAGRRVSTAALEGFALDALNYARRKRPDLFLGNWGNLAPVTGSAPLPIDDQYFRPIVDYMIARAESKDAEHVLSARSELMAKLAAGGFE